MARVSSQRASATAALGRFGEAVAGRHLESLGWEVLARNWRCEHGELDLVARDPTGALVAVEVKTRRGTGFGLPVEAVTRSKAQRLRRLLVAFAQRHPVGAPALRIDVVGVLVRPAGRPELVHVPGVGA